MQKITLRPYQSTDLNQSTTLFYETIHTINAQDYSKEQLDVWATRQIDNQAWDLRFTKDITYVAVLENIIVGFANIQPNGYLDCLYVHKDYQHKGIATKLCDTLESLVTTKEIMVHSSITAQGFFAKRNYKTIKQQEVIRQGVKLTNFIMIKHL